MEVLNNSIMLASEASDICNKFSGVFGLIGWAVIAIQIAVPILLILMGMIGMTKAVISQKDDEIKSALSSFIKKAIAAICVFAVITVVKFLFTTIVGFSDWNIGKCNACLNNPSGCKINKG